MASTTLSCSGATYLNPLSPAADYSSATKLPSAHSYPNESTRQRYTGIGFMCPAAVLRFTRSNAIKYKKINQVVLNLELEPWNNGSSSVQTFYYSVQPYKCSAALSSINYNSYTTTGIVGEWSEKASLKHSNGSNVEISIDITSLFSNNLDGDTFNVIVAASACAYYETNQGTPGVGSCDIIKSSATLSVDYEAVDQLPPTPIYPKDMTLVESETTFFAWQYNSATEATQTHVDIQYKKTTASSYTTISLDQTEHSYTLATRLTAGSYQWRARVTNDVNETSAYSEVAYFDVIGKPAAPIIGDPENKTLTAISWSSSEQYAYELKLMDANGNEMVHETQAAATSVFRPNFFLNGNYVFAIRIKNAADLWSDWAQRAFSITAAGPEAAVLSAVVDGTTQFELQFSIPSGVEAAIIRTDESGAEKVLVAGLTEGDASYIDNTIESDKAYTYKVRTYVDGYTDTTGITATAHYIGFIVGNENGELNLELSEDKFMPHSEAMTRDASIMLYSGRLYPLVETGEHVSVEIGKRAFVTGEQKVILDEICRSVKVFYRDGKGNSYPAAVTKLSYQEYQDEGYIVTLTLVRTEEAEVIFNV